MFLLMCAVLVLFPREAAEGAKEGIRVAFETVLPSILPFAAISSAVIYSGLGERLGRFLSPFCEKRLRLNPYGVVAFLSGLLGGYPVGARVVCDLYMEGDIDKKEAEKMLAYSNNCSVVFAVNVCGEKLFSDAKCGWQIFFVHILSALVVALIMGRSEKKEILVKKKRVGFMAALGKGIKSGGFVILNILASFIVMYALMNAFRVERLPFVSGLCEMTSGVSLAGEMKNCALGAFYISLGGLAIFAQTAAVCAEAELSLEKFYIGKALSAAISLLIGILAFR